jgi:hypothetical protein
MVKGFNLPIDYVLYDMSYANMIMYGSVLPSYNNKKEETKNKKGININTRDGYLKMLEMTK